MQPGRRRTCEITRLAQLRMDDGKKVQFAEPEFQPSYETFTPHISNRKIKYKQPSARQAAVAHAPPSSVSKPNIDDALRRCTFFNTVLAVIRVLHWYQRVSVVTYQHIGRCEHKRMQQMHLEATRRENGMSRFWRVTYGRTLSTLVFTARTPQGSEHLEDRG